MTAAATVDDAIRRALTGSGGFLTTAEVAEATGTDRPTARRRLRALHLRGELGRLSLSGATEAVWWLLDPQIS